MASIYKLPSGLWRAQIDKRGIRESESRASRAEAKNWAIQRESEIEADFQAGKTGARRSSGGVTVGELFNLFLDMEASKTDTAKWNRLRINNWQKSTLAGKLVTSIVPHDINEWVQERQKTVSNATVNRELNLMSSAFRYAIKAKQWIEINPCHGVNRPADARGRHRALLTEDELHRIAIATGFTAQPQLSTATSRVGACFFLALETAARSGEILRIKPEHYRPEQRTLWVAAEEQGGRKSSRSGRVQDKASRHVPLTERAMELLDQLQATMPAGQPYLVGVSDAQRDALARKAFKKALVEDLKFHDTKHEAATKLSKFLDVIALSHAIGTKDLRLLRDTYYVNDASAAALLLPKVLSKVPLALP